LIFLIFFLRKRFEHFELLDVFEVVRGNRVVFVEGNSVGLLLVVDILFRVEAKWVVEELLLVEYDNLVVVGTVGLVMEEGLVGVVVLLQKVCVFLHEVLELMARSFQGEEGFEVLSSDLDLIHVAVV
jgi:hypothetical protein